MEITPVVDRQRLPTPIGRMDISMVLNSSEDLTPKTELTEVEPLTPPSSFDHYSERVAQRSKALMLGLQNAHACILTSFRRCNP